MDAPTPTLAPFFFRDLADGIQQQMFFWGRDVMTPSGNFLVDQGFQRDPSPGLKGTSRYRLPWQDGCIELYGACAGWYGAERGFTFIRPRRRCAIWLSRENLPIPGAWRTELIDTTATRDERYAASLPFIDWLISYERAVRTSLGGSYRQQNYLQYRKVPKARAWIEPEAALRWFEQYRHAPEKLVRPKTLSQQLS